MPKVYLKDYKASDYAITNIHMTLDLDEDNTVVTSIISIKKQNMDSNAPLVLNGGNFQLESIMLNENMLNERFLDESEYSIKDKEFTLHHTPEKEFSLTIVTKINPKNNRELQGLYEADGLLTTHCEAEGFRNITYFLDRPDVLTTYSTRILANKNKYPVLLANGNLVLSGIDPEDSTRHFAIYHDPIPKPSYLFAMVAGQLELRKDYFKTCSNKDVTLNIFVPAEDLHKTEHAMQALKEAMRFDEEHYDREYDLEIYNIVGVPQFNMGAMENKGLNIFNNSSLLAHYQIATDENFERVSSVVGHEYFHNWRGNRVTVENWFNLSLKEGFATITEQEFSQSLYKSKVPRIRSINELINKQFSQDASPLAHPVMPAEYEDTDNLYTKTIYLKGAELLNMLKSMLGKETFKRGCSIYFRENDGSAANIKKFLGAMEQASNRDLSQFLLWYQQAGTPHLEFEEEYNSATQTYSLAVKQSCPPTPGQEDKKLLLIPIVLGLLNKNGQDIELQLQDENKPQGTTRTLELTQPVQTFTFVGVKEKPVPSLLRNFSAPVKIVKSPISTEELKFLLKHDNDPVNRWFASRNIARQAILAIIQDLQKGKTPTLNADFMECYRAVLLDPTIEPRLTTELLTFPPVESFFDSLNPVDPDLIHRARDFFVNGFILSCYKELKSTYTTISKIDASPSYSPESASIRALKNLCLSYLMKSNHPEATQLCIQQLHRADNMTDILGALAPLAIYYNEDRLALRQEELDKFAQKWQDDVLVIQQLFQLYALSHAPDALEQIIKVTQSPMFKKDNPDHIWSLLKTFSSANPLRFHDASGKSYQFIADFIIECDALNPASASSLVPSLVDWKIWEPTRRKGMLEQLYRIHNTPNISDRVKELVAKSIDESLHIKDYGTTSSVTIKANINQAQEEENKTLYKEGIKFSVFNQNRQNHPEESEKAQNTITF